MTDREPLSVLVSFHYYRGDAAIRVVTDALRYARDRGQPVRLLADSGAFSALTQGQRITTADYARWLDVVAPLWGEWLAGAVNLDVIGQHERSWANWQALRDAGHDTIPVTHLGDSYEVADAYVAAGADYLGTGNLVGSRADRMLRWCAHLHRHLRDHHPHVRLHGLGATGRQVVERLPWWSVDSSSFGSGYRYGRLLVFDPAVRAPVSVGLPGSRSRTVQPTTDLYRYGPLLRQVYGVDPAQVHSATPENRRLLVRIAALSCQLWQADLRARRAVTPPPSGDRDGTHVHFVDGHAEFVAQAIEEATDHPQPTAVEA